MTYQPGDLGFAHSTGAAAFGSGSGAPSNSYGANGDFYFKTETPSTSNQRLYVKAAGSWSALL